MLVGDWCENILCNIVEWSQILDRQEDHQSSNKDGGKAEPKYAVSIAVLLVAQFKASKLITTTAGRPVAAGISFKQKLMSRLWIKIWKGTTVLKL